MAFEKLVSFTKDVSDLADKPALGSAAALKAQFDAAPDEVRVYLNKLIDSLKSTVSGDSGAKNIGASAITGVNGTDVQSQLEGIKTYSDGKFVSGTGERLEVASAFFFTNGSSNESTVTVSFTKPFQSPPAVFPGNIPQNVSYGDVLYHPYIYNVTTTGFQCKIVSAGTLGTATPANLIMSFLAIGK